jgi:arginyl-tRNA synthetase
MLEMRGNTAAYLLYQLTRIRSVVRKVDGKVSVEEMKKVAGDESFFINHPRELKLAKTILKFHEVLHQAQRDLLIHPICEWMYLLSNVFSQFYNECYIIENLEGVEKIHVGRLILAEATAKVMEAAFKILGIQTLHKM